jgi:RNA polymerase sigma-70 factor (ECF subfamily)
MRGAGISDGVILERLRTGSHEAYAILFQRYWKTCFDLAYRKTGDEQEALDIVQNLFIYLWEKRTELPPELHLPAYLATAVKNRVINWYRQQQKSTAGKEALLQLLHTRNESPASSEYYALQQEWFSAVDTLPDRMKEIYLLRHQQELSILEISRKLNLRPQSVKNQLSIAIHRVRSILAALLLSLITLLTVFLRR